MSDGINSVDVSKLMELALQSFQGPGAADCEESDASPFSNIQQTLASIAVLANAFSGNHSEADATEADTQCVSSQSSDAEMSELGVSSSKNGCNGNNVETCPLCQRAVPKRKMSTHMRTHTGERPFQCDYCDKSFARSDKLKMHLRIHTGERPYLCFCGKKFARQDKCKKHLNTHPLELVLQHQDKIVAPCRDSMLSNIRIKAKLLQGPSQSYRDYLKTLSDSVALVTDDPQTATEISDIKMKLNLESLFHCQVVESEETSSLLSELPETDHEENISCQHCDSVFRTKRAYFSHVKGHNRKEVYNCSCGREFKSAKWLSNHQKREGCLVSPDRIEMTSPSTEESPNLSLDAFTHDLEQSVCSHSVNPADKSSIIQADAPFDTSADQSASSTSALFVSTPRRSLSEEEDVDSEKGPPTKRFAEDPKFEEKQDNSSPVSIKVEKLQSGEFNPSPDNSSNDIFVKANLKRKDDDKKFKCDYCLKLFAKKHKMQIHRRMHTGEKPYICEVCGKAFSRKDHMVKHMNVHLKYRKQSAEENSEKIETSCSGPLSVECSDNNPVQSAIPGVSIMLQERSELQTKRRAVDALTKALWIQRALGVSQAEDFSPPSLPESYELNSFIGENFTLSLLESCLLKAKNKKVCPNFLKLETVEFVSEFGKYKCMECTLRFTKSSAFLTHLRTAHKVHGNSKFICGVCKCEVWTRRRYETHVAAHSDSEQDAEEDELHNEDSDSSRTPSANELHESDLTTLMDSFRNSSSHSANVFDGLFNGGFSISEPTSSNWSANVVDTEIESPSSPLSESDSSALLEEVPSTDKIPAQTLSVDDFLTILNVPSGQSNNEGNIQAKSESESSDNEDSLSSSKVLTELNGFDSLSKSTGASCSVTSSTKMMQCSICHKRVHECNFLRHTATHAKVNKCELCGTTFSRSADVARHMKLHSRDQIFSCEGCGLSFAKKDKLTMHLRRCTASQKANWDVTFASLFTNIAS